MSSTYITWFKYIILFVVAVLIVGQLWAFFKEPLRGAWSMLKTARGAIKKR